MTFGDEAVVRFEVVAPHIALVTINRPDARNSINAEVAAALEAASIRVEDDPELWVAVLTGAGDKAFCAGADLKEVAQGGLNAMYTERGSFAGFVQRPDRKIWIAAVEGFAVAGGCEIALACDMIVASEQAEFALPEVKRGLIAAAGGAYRLPRMIPRAIAMELIATGNRIGAPRAHALGMINRLTPSGGAVAGAIALATKICENAPLAVRESIGIARLSADRQDSELLQLSLDRQAVLMETEDFAEGPRAFIEKRPPRWRGR